MTGFIEFDYETVDGQTLDIKGEIVKNNIKFYAYNEDGDLISKRYLNSFDIRNIIELIEENAEEEIEYESDFYERSND